MNGMDEAIVEEIDELRIWVSRNGVRDSSEIHRKAMEMIEAASLRFTNTLQMAMGEATTTIDYEIDRGDFEFDDEEGD